jgi:hypothetical protein
VLLIELSAEPLGVEQETLAVGFAGHAVGNNQCSWLLAAEAHEAGLGRRGNGRTWA